MLWVDIINRFEQLRASKSDGQDSDGLQAAAAYIRGADWQVSRWS